MSIKRYIASKDTTITNAYKLNGITRGENANMGASDILEAFSIYGQISDDSLEKSRILIDFPISDIISDRSSNKIGPSGSVEFILKLSNASHTQSTPDNLSLIISPLSRNWSEGSGLDMEGYSDVGYANWNRATETVSWTNQGGDTISGSDINIILELPTDDLSVDITSLVEDWISGTKDKNGLLIKLSSSQEDSTESYYTKKFFARRSQFFYKKPWIEARTKDFIKDKRNNFYSNSQMLSEEDNTNIIYIYNKFNGTFKNIPSIGTGSAIVRVFSGSITSGPVGYPLSMSNGMTHVTGGFYSTGIYSASINVATSNEIIYDVWYDLSGNILLTGSAIYVNQYDIGATNNSTDYILAIPEIKNKYSFKDYVKMRVYGYNRDWDSNIFTVSSKENPVKIIDNLYFKITRIADSYEVLEAGTGSYQHTLCSYDNISNYFSLDMSLLEPGYSYRLEFLNKENDYYVSLKDSFKFRVE
jgi:hypothetical protein